MAFFWEYFKESSFYDNTIIVVTADHTIPPTVEYRKIIRPKNQAVSFFDEITLIIFDKRYNFPKRLKVKASSIDLVPTILQLLNINNILNPFQGLSIFSDRKEHPSLLCTLMSGFYTYDNNGILFNSYADDKELGDTYDHMTTNIYIDKNKQETGMKLWFAYNKMLNNNNMIWNGIFEQHPHADEVKY